VPLHTGLTAKWEEIVIPYFEKGGEPNLQHRQEQELVVTRNREEKKEG